MRETGSQTNSMDLAVRSGQMAITTKVFYFDEAISSGG